MTYDPRAHGADCGHCPLKGQDVVPPAPARGRVSFVIVGEAPGATEENERRPFVGRSGKMLDAALVRHGFSRGECHVTNATLCRPETDKQGIEAAKHCAPRLLAELPTAAPIVALGSPGRAFATRSLLAYRNILVARGFVWTAPIIDPAAIAKAAKEKKVGAPLKALTLAGRAALAGRLVFPMLHPSYVMRAPTWNTLWETDWRRARRIIDGASWDRDEETHAVGGPELLDSEWGPEVSCDIETSGVEWWDIKILCVGLSDARRTAVIFPWRDRYAARLEAFFNARRAVIGHNYYAFDSLVLRAHGVAPNWANMHDTLTAHHAYASHLPQRLDQVVSETQDSAPWKVVYGRRGEPEK